MIELKKEIFWNQELPKELWEPILAWAEESASLKVCKLFKEIIYDPAFALKYLNLYYKDQLPGCLYNPQGSKEDALKLARVALVDKLKMLEIKETKGINYFVFTSILKDEYLFNLTVIFLRIINDNFRELIIGSKFFFPNFFFNNKGFFSKLKCINLNKLGITLIPKELELFIGLKEINVALNHLTHLPEFFGNSWPKMKKCNLSYNQLTYLPKEFGNNFSNLKTLNLAHNRIEELAQFAEACCSLKKLDLSLNEIEKIPLYFGKNWSELENISLFHNKIKKLPSDFGTYWPKLKILMISQNPVEDDVNLQDRFKYILI